MKKKITALLAGIFALVITTYAQTPTVTFTATPAVVCDSGSVAFTNTAVNFPNTWAWYFPGSTTPYILVTGGTGNPPSNIQYDYPGTYNVTCVVRNGSPSDPSDSTVVVGCVTVLPLPKATIMPPYGGICSGQDTVQFSMINATAGNTYSWSPSGGLFTPVPPTISCTTCPNPKASPTVSTVYTISVTGANGCSTTLHDTVTVGPIIAYITGRDTLCAGMVDTLRASGGSSATAYGGIGTTYIWTPGGATTSSITISPTVSTTYTVDITSGANSCFSSATYRVYVYPKPSFTFTITPADSICLGQSADINISPPLYSPYQYVWWGPNASPDTTAAFVTTPTLTTSYTLVTQEIKGCRYDSVIKIKVNPPPHVTFTGATDLCQGSTTTLTVHGGQQYIWYNGATTSSINVTGIVSFTYTVQVNSGNCFKDTSFYIEVDTMPHNDFIVKGINDIKSLEDTSICIGDSVTIYASILPKSVHGGYEYNYLWNTGATVDSITTGPLITGQTYYVKVTHGACSLDSSEITIKVYPPPVPIAYPANTTICQWDSVLLTAAGGDYYQWTPGPMPSSGLDHYYRIIDTDRNEASPSQNTLYTVKVCTWGCCKDTSITVNVTPGVLGFNVCCSDTVSSGTPVNLSATFDPGPYSVVGWTFAGPGYLPAQGLSCTTCPNPVATVDTTTEYVVTFLDNATGCYVKDSVTIDIFNCNVFVPNAFSPNDDGVNDKLYVRSLCMKSMDFAVYDRFGNRIFETQNQNTPWDGTYRGKPSSVGTYMWYLNGILSDGTHIARSGNVTLVR